MLSSFAVKARTGFRSRLPPLGGSCRRRRLMRGASWDRQGHPGFDKLTAGSGAAGLDVFAVGLGLRPGHIFCLGPGVPARAVFREDRYDDLVLGSGTATA